tara:strand:+ start:1206 stop:1796 length:591 start_codon:yes stop_codon:yes gene_type:complete
MSERKRKLIAIQSLLLLLAITIFYFVYYYKNIKNQDSELVNSKLIESNEKDTTSNYFEDVEYKGIDVNGNRYVLKSQFASFDEQNPELINMVNMNAIFYFKNGKILNIYGDNGKYNNISNDMEFRENVKVIQDTNKIFSDNLDYFNSKRMINIYGNVEGESLDGTFESDVLELDIEKQTVNFLMNNREQVKINLNK